MAKTQKQRKNGKREQEKVKSRFFIDSAES